MSLSETLFADAPMTILLPTKDHFTNEPILPDLILWIYIAVIVGVGLMLNAIMIGVLLKSKCYGKGFF